MSPRVASESSVTGLMLTNAWSQPGIVLVGTRALLTNVSGNNVVMPKSWTFSGSAAHTPTNTDTHEKTSAKIRIRATAARTPATEVPIRAVRAEQAQHRAGTDGEVHPVEGRGLAEALDQPLGPDHVIHRWLLSRISVSSA